MSQQPDVGAESAASSSPATDRRRIVLIGVLFSVALLALGFLVGYALNRGGDRSNQALAIAVPAGDSVEAGFLRDMITHHDQAVVMAHDAEIHSTDPEIQRTAYDLLTTQQGQIGTMSGWLMLWQLPQQVYVPRMAWMGSDMAGHGMGGMGSGTAAAATSGQSADGALMPGMATDAQMEQLSTLRGSASDVLFLQLMIRHHQGGSAMMRYAETHASNPIVTNFAGQMANTQDGEVAVMTQMLKARGAQPLPAP
ncbi:MAG: DUF305 domain-containing protein [Nakamurella sp.]